MGWHADGWVDRLTVTLAGLFTERDLSSITEAMAALEAEAEAIMDMVGRRSEQQNQARQQQQQQVGCVGTS